MIEDLYGCKPLLGGWYWGRAEWQHRGIVHYHYLLRLPNRLPDPIKLANTILKGYKFRVELIGDAEITEAEQLVIDSGERAEKELIAYHDALLSSDVSESIVGYRGPQNGQQTPMNKKSTSIGESD